MTWGGVSVAVDRELAWLFGGVGAVLGLATVAALLRRRRVAGEASRAAVASLTAQITAWWAMCAVFVLAVLTGRIGSVVLFGLTSFLALREFITLTPTTRSDHAALSWAFFVFTPLQYALVALGWYGVYTVLIPVYAFLFIPTRSVLAGGRERFLERTATVQWGLMVCVYCASHAPALLGLEIPGYRGQNGKLLVFFVLAVQVSDVLRHVVGRWAGGPRLGPSVSAGTTWAGLAGGLGGAALLGGALWWATPFAPWPAAALSLLTALMGFFGKLTMAAIKRDRGVKEFGTLMGGHGVLDRIDSICFAAPVFFHVTRYLFAA